MSYRSIRLLLEEHHPRKNNLNAGNLVQALKAAAFLQLSKSIQPIIIDYDESNSILNIVDRRFIFWLASQDKNDLLSLADISIK